MRSARKKATNFWAPQSSQPNGKPIRSPRACSIAAKRSLQPRGRADDFSWPRADTSGAADMEPAPDAVRPRGSVGTSELDEEHGSAANKPQAAKSGEAKNRQTQSPPTPKVTVARPRRNEQLTGSPPRPPLPVGTMPR